MPLKNFWQINFQIDQARMDKLAVYIHWPYCARICPYCDFNVYKRREDDTLLPAILQDLSYWRELSGPREISSIHFGGGTPSLMHPTQVGAVINQVDKLWGLGTVEIALEANPHEMNAADWHGYKEAGLNRLSLGVQSFQDSALKLLGRDHDGATALSALSLAMDIFPNVSADLIFGWAGQTLEELDHDLETLLSLKIPHISTYQLTIEDGTAFARAEARGLNRAVSSDQSADFYERVAGRLKANEFRHYEVSNFAISDYESEHNLAYWRGIDYVGVGPGAHGRITRDGVRQATVAYLSPRAYTDAASTASTGIESIERLSPHDWASEYLLMGLRIDEGISLSRFSELAGKNLPELELEHLISDGYLLRSGDKIIATQAGRFVLNAVTEALLIP